MAKTTKEKAHTENATIALQLAAHNLGSLDISQSHKEASVNTFVNALKDQNEVTRRYAQDLLLEYLMAINTPNSANAQGVLKKTIEDGDRQGLQSVCEITSHCRSIILSGAVAFNNLDQDAHKALLKKLERTT
jgi:hypothetical protein